MSFATIETFEKKSFTKTNFMRLTPGDHIVRILDKEATLTHSHYLNGMSIACLGEDCPVCANNKKLIMEYPEDFKKQTGWNPYTRRYSFNVLDRTPVKVCPKGDCQHENKRGANGQYPPTCEVCGTFITSVTETVSNKVKLLTVGVENANQLNAYELSLLDSDKNPIGLTNFDIMFTVKGEKKDKKVVPIPLIGNNDVVEVPADSMFDPKSAVINLSESEIGEFIEGVKLKDIFNARRGDTAESKVADIANEINDEVAKLLGK